MGLGLNDQMFFLWAAEVLKFSLTLMQLEAAHGCIKWCPWDFTKWSPVHFIVMSNSRGTGWRPLRRNKATGWPQPGP